MRFLFVLRESVLKVFESPIRSLCDGGDEVLVLVEAPRELGRLVERLAMDVPGLRVHTVGPEEQERAEGALGNALRVWTDYLGYFEPRLEAATRYREQRGRGLPEGLRRDTDASTGFGEVSASTAA
jgi:hypothetical protein